MQANHDAVYFVTVVCLPLLVRVLMVPRFGEPVRAWSERLGTRVWAHLVERDEPDEHQLRRWALTRLDELERNLARVTSLVADDEEMSATRQIANRIAYARLEVDVDDARAAVPDRPERPPTTHTWQPNPAPVRYLASPVLASASTVEILEF